MSLNKNCGVRYKMNSCKDPTVCTGGVEDLLQMTRQGLDGFEEGSLICNHLQDACDMCRGVSCPWRGWKEANTPQTEEGEQSALQL